jgi:hypothetical protein
MTAAAFGLAMLAGCASQKTETIAADDEALCQYSAAAGGATATDSKSYGQCRARLKSQSARNVAGNAARIEGYALLPAAAPPTTDVATRCKADPKAKGCEAGDVTGTIPAQPKH